MILKLFFIIFTIFALISFQAHLAYGQSNSQVSPTDRGSLNVKLSTTPENPKPGDLAKLNINFINPYTKKIQEHIDYRVTVLKDGVKIIRSASLIHTSTGSIKIPVEFQEKGTYFALIEVEGILFQPIPLETVTFAVSVGETQTNNYQTPAEGGGCLIATAAYGSELSFQIQQLREIRDNVVSNTTSGMAFLTTFNQFYYSFSPSIADLERESPTFKETVKLIITPLLTSLSILNYVDIDSEEEMIGYGTGIIMLNIGMYFVAPLSILKIINHFVRNHNLVKNNSYN